MTSATGVTPPNNSAESTRLGRKSTRLKQESACREQGTKFLDQETTRPKQGTACLAQESRRLKQETTRLKQGTTRLKQGTTRLEQKTTLFRPRTTLFGLCSTRGTHSPRLKRSAFTLIEVALAMFIVVLVIGIGLPFATGMGREGQLREPASELKKMALTARRRAVTQQKTVEILLENHRYVLRDAVLKDPSDRIHIAPEPSQTRQPRTLSPQGQSDATQISSYDLPRNVTYAVKRWDETKFATKTDANWRFLPTGLCEPITVHFNRDEDFIEFSFNPLTAQTEDESFTFR